MLFIANGNQKLEFGTWNLKSSNIKWEIEIRKKKCKTGKNQKLSKVNTNKYKILKKNFNFLLFYIENLCYIKTCYNLVFVTKNKISN